MSESITVYAIYDTRKGQFFKRGAKGAWLTRGAAKNALLYDMGCISRDKADWCKHFNRFEINSDWLHSEEWKTRYLSFANQTRYECLEYELLERNGAPV